MVKSRQEVWVCELAQTRLAQIAHEFPFLGVGMFGVRQDGATATTAVLSPKGRGGMFEELGDYRMGVMPIALRWRKTLARATNFPDGSPARIRALSLGES